MYTAPRSHSRTSSLALSLIVALLVVAGCGGNDTDGPSPESTSTAPPMPADELALQNPWVRPTAAGGNTALYFTLANGLSTPDTLTSVRAPIIDSTMIHQTTADASGTSSMRAMGTLPIPPKSRVTLEPGGKHVMLMGVQQTLRDGDSVVLNVEFAEAGLRRIQADVRATPPSN